MTFSPRIPAIATVLATALLAACTSALAANGNGGAAFSSGSTPGQVGDAQFHAAPTAILGSDLSFAGTASPGGAVAIQRLDTKAHQWVTAATATADAQGNFVARWHTDQSGVFSVRVVPAGDHQVRASSAPPTVQVTVFKRSLATWFGPGFYGHKTACGQKMTRALVGVASRTLPCGSRVSFLYRGQTVTVPVVDRGPYGRSGANWDLTYAAAQQLGFDYTDKLGAVVVRRGR